MAGTKMEGCELVMIKTHRTGDPDGLSPCLHLVLGRLLFVVTGTIPVITVV